MTTGIATTMVKTSNDPSQWHHEALLRKCLDIGSKRVGDNMNWRRFLETWVKADEEIVLRGLLHGGFEIYIEDPTEEKAGTKPNERLMLYFAFADNWENNSSSSSLCNLRIKARQMLRKNLFALDVEHGEASGFENERCIRAWEWKVLRNMALPQITQFFSVRKSLYKGPHDYWIRNVEGMVDHTKKDKQPNRHEVEFLIELCKFIWRWYGEYTGNMVGHKKVVADEKNRRYGAMIAAAKPWSIEVLSALDRIDLLEEHRGSIDQVCLDKLTEIALRRQFSAHIHRVPKDRCAESIDEAIFLGSPEALLVKRMQIDRDVQERLARKTK